MSTSTDAASVTLYIALALYETSAREAIVDAEVVERTLLDAARAGGFTVFDKGVVRFPSTGVTATVIVGESHLSIHTWPKEGRVFIDIASCSTEQSVWQALEVLVAQLRLNPRQVELRRLSG